MWAPRWFPLKGTTPVTSYCHFCGFSGLHNIIIRYIVHTIFICLFNILLNLVTISATNKSSTKVPFKECLLTRPPYFATPPGSSDKTKSYLNEWGKSWNLKKLQRSGWKIVFVLKNKRLTFSSAISPVLSLTWSSRNSNMVILIINMLIYYQYCKQLCSLLNFFRIFFGICDILKDFLINKK